MLKNIIGVIIKFAFANTFNENLLAIVLLTIKNSSININGDVLKYITCSVSEKFFTTNIGTNNNNKIYKIPIIIVSVFPPRNLQTSRISCPWNFLNKNVINTVIKIAKM